MTRQMYDSVNANSVPAGADLYAGYVDGNYANVDQLRRRFPHRTIVTVTVIGLPGANVCDCETGDLTPEHAARWASNEIHAGRKPTIYCNASTWPAVRERVRAYGITGKVSYWIAQYDGRADIPAGAIAKQYLGDHPNGHGGTYDASIVADHWPGVDPDPTPPRPKPQPIEGDDVQRMLEDQRHTPNPVWMADGMERRWIATGAERDFWRAQGVPLIPVSSADAPHIIDPLPIKPGTKVPA